MPSARPLDILVVDDHAIVREGVHRILSDASPGWQVFEAAGAAEALLAMRQRRFDLLIADLSMPGMGGLELISRVRAQHPETVVLVLSMHVEEPYAVRALRAGASGYLTKDRAGGELVEAVRKVAQGGAYVSPDVAERMALGLRTSGAPAHARLTDREFDVLRRIVGGQRPATIARELHLSVKTVSTHKRRIMDKLGLESTASLVRYGLEQGLLSAPVVPS